VLLAYRARSEVVDYTGGVTHTVIGIDVGGTGIKGAAVDVLTGERLTTRFRVATPPGGMPADIANAVAAMSAQISEELSHTPSQAPHRPASAPVIGVALPGATREGYLHTAANIDQSWIGTDAQSLLSNAVGLPCIILNDADAAGVAEATLGAAQGLSGTVMVVTFGTGIGTACMSNGVLVPNFELGHLQLDGHLDAEVWASPKAIAREGLSLSEWAHRAGRYLQHVEMLLHPSHFVLGGSISKDAARFLPLPGVNTPTVAAQLRNDAGIVGAACFAADQILL
jgi:polyphosphate glucokinase